MLLCLGVAACGATADEERGTVAVTSAALTDAPALIPGEAPGKPALTVNWVPLAEGATLAAKDAVSVEVANSTNEPRKATVLLTAAGLGGRQVEQPLGVIDLGAKERKLWSVRVRDLPMQSQQEPLFLAVQVDVESPGGPLRLSTPPRYYRFGKAYGEAAFWSAEGVVAEHAALAPKGPTTAAVAGRLRGTDGRWLDASVLTTEGLAAAKGGGQQGTAWVGVSADALPGAEASPGGVDVADGELVPADPAGPIEATADSQVGAAAAGPAAATEGAVGALAATTWGYVCANWYVYFADARGTGVASPMTDYFWQTGWHFEKARYAYASLTSSDGSTTHWQGYLNSSGCTPYLQLENGNYRLYQYTMATKRNNVTFRHWRLIGTQEVYSYFYTPFTYTGGSSTTLVVVNPTFNSTDSQAAALTGQLLCAHALGGSNLVADGYYNIHSNRDCPGEGYVNSSCATYPDVYITGWSLAGWPLAYWRFVVAHEIGHSVQYRASGIPNGSDYDLTKDPNPICTCDHVEGPDAPKAHCLQSREHTWAAQGEGIAHAFATRAFNSPSGGDGAFIYYKEFLEVENGPKTYPPVARDAYTPARWLETRKCKVEANTAVEWDWLTFFYSVGTTNLPNEVPFTDLYLIYKKACGNAMCDDWDFIDWQKLQTAAQTQYSTSPNQFQRFNSALGAHGVNH